MNPAISESKLRQIVTAQPVIQHWASNLYPAMAVGVRGYYRDTMGKPGVNDVGIYDDAIFFLPAKQGMAAFRANVDPSRLGWNSEIGKPYAQLVSGLWYFLEGHHKSQPRAWRQPDDASFAVGLPPNYSTDSGQIQEIRQGRFKVYRDPDPLKPGQPTEIGHFQIDIHAGGWSSTSSWGCQTLRPEDHDQWVAVTYDGTEKQLLSGKRVLPYLLINGPIN